MFLSSRLGATAPQLLSPKLVRLHDVRTAFTGLSVTGIEHYPERSLLLPGLPVVTAGFPAMYFSYLQQVQIGIGRPSSGYLEVPAGTNLVSTFGARHLESVQTALNLGMSLEFFLATPTEQHFVESVLGREFAGSVWGPSPALAARVNDKIWLRRFVERTGLPIRFAEYRIVRLDRRRAVVAAARKLLERHPGVLIKLADQASGDGQEFVYPDRTPDWEAAVDDAVRALRAHLHRRGRAGTGEILVEAAYPQHVPLSTQLEVDDSGTDYLCATLMQVTDGTVHDGNTLSSDRLPGVPDWVMAAMEEQSRALTEALRPLGYRGYGGVDFMLTLKSGQPHELLCLEKNGRPTGAMYPLAVALQAQANHHLPGWAVTTGNLAPDRPHTFVTLAGELDRAGLLFDGATGALPVAPSLVPGGKAMVYCIAPTVAAAQAMMGDVRSLLGSP